MRPENEEALRVLEFRIRAILPEEYQDCYEEVQPVSMGSAGLKYDGDGKVAWDDIWGSFCDLAMAGGPPHKGSLLEPGSREAIEAHPARYQEVAAEICRGIHMVTGLGAAPDAMAGWIRVECANEGMAEWLVRAIVMENVSARCEGNLLYLPAGPAYRIEKEVKNVITAIAKTCHYWEDHMWSAQQREIAHLFKDMDRESPLIQPALGDDTVAENELIMDLLGKKIEEGTGLRRSAHRYRGWFGLQCPDVRVAIWMMRALVVSNTLSRREDTVLFIPVNASRDPAGEIVANALIQVHGFEVARRVSGGVVES